MNDPNPTDPRSSDDRAERALRRAFDDRADAVDSTPLDPALLLTRRDLARSTAGDADARVPEPLVGAAPPPTGDFGDRRRRRPAVWWSAAAAVAVVALGVPLMFSLGGGVGMFTASSGVRGGSSEAAAPELDSAASDAGNASRPADGDAAYDAGGAPGTRRVSFLDVVVDVPAGWGYGFAPGPDWCAETGAPRPSGPYVDRNPLSRAVRAISCDARIPDAEQQTHLTWRYAEPGDAPASELVGGWRTVSRPIGAAYVSVVGPVGESALAEQILDSGRVVDVDPNGCPVRLPEGTPGEGRLRDLAGAAMASICQYAVDAAGRPELVGSSALDGDAADGLLRGITGQAWADDVGEDLECAPTGSVLVARFTDAADAVRVARLSLSDGCGFGWYDGVSAWPPSQATCGDLLVGPLWLATTDDRWAPFCAPR